ncbi:MAG: nicotinate-nucleotide adenylyltransferase [Ignavibacteria bacterium]|nr:nicotinate-nucleotide adenylyltransferase [Ignavibacteria bacterium]
MKKIGLFGGTFNPIHIAHLIIADSFAQNFNLDKCLFVPAHISPFKKKSKSATDTLVAHRLKMLKLAIKDNPKFGILTYEVDKGGISYSIDTVDHLKEKEPATELYLLIGTDQAEEFKLWKKWEKLLTLVQLCIARRQGLDSKKMEKEISHSLTINKKKPEWLDTPMLDISSEDIRDKVLLEKSIKYYVPASVEKYILSNNLYK